MTKPTEPLPIWATDANYASPGDPWDVTPTKVDPGGGQRAEGWEPGEPHPAQFENFDRNAIGAWLSWIDSLWTAGEEHVYDLGVPRQRIIGASALGLAIGTEWALVSRGASPNQGYGITSLINTPTIILPLHRLVPSGAVITNIQAMVEPGAARAVQTTDPGDNGRMTLHRFNSTYNFGPDTEILAGPLSAVEDDGTTNLQSLEMPGLSLTINAITNVQHYVVVQGGNTGAASPDDVVAFQITFDDSGLRNF